jgi:hypothetical protein
MLKKPSLKAPVALVGSSKMQLDVPVAGFVLN